MAEAWAAVGRRRESTLPRWVVVVDFFVIVIDVVQLRPTLSRWVVAVVVVVVCFC